MPSTRTMPTSLRCSSPCVLASSSSASHSEYIYSTGFKIQGTLSSLQASFVECYWATICASCSSCSSGRGCDAISQALLWQGCTGRAFDRSWLIDERDGSQSTFLLGNCLPEGNTAGPIYQCMSDTCTRTPPLESWISGAFWCWTVDRTEAPRRLKDQTTPRRKDEFWSEDVVVESRKMKVGQEPPPF